MSWDALSIGIQAPQNRLEPVYRYLPGHYTAADLAYHVDALDIVGARAYAEQPHAWVRWRVDSEIEAIEGAGHTTDERTPLGVVGVFNAEMFGYSGIPDGTEVLHDHLAAVAAGAHGLYTFSWWHAVHDADTGESAEAILEIATRVKGWRRSESGCSAARTSARWTSR